jgi:trypsin
MMLWTGVVVAWGGSVAGVDGGDGARDVPVLTAPDPTGPDAVVGGKPVNEGKWEDAVGIVFFSSYVGCTGTLIGPRTVLTAGHCVVGTDVSHVLIGSTNWLDPDQGELIEVDVVHEYPNSQGTYDVALLELDAASTYTPRALALDCVIDEHLSDGAKVQMVGFGGTNASGVDYFNSEKNEAATTVVDKNCSEDYIGNVITGCNDAVRPGGELVAGETGTSVCYGDSGGPLYLKTADGDFVVGVASRLIFGPNFYSAPCTEGGVWVRPDAFIEWIEDTVGARKVTYPVCNAAPTVEIPELVTHKNAEGSVTVEVTDPDGDGGLATMVLVVEPEHGTAAVDGLTLTYTPDEGFVGEDVLTVAVSDVGTEWKRTGGPLTADFEVPVTVKPGFLGLGCATGAPSPAWLAPLLLLGLRRRR